MPSVSKPTLILNETCNFDTVRDLRSLKLQVVDRTNMFDNYHTLLKYSFKSEHVHLCSCINQSILTKLDRET